VSGRIRSIKPEMLEDARIAELSDGAFRLFTGMILLADDSGRLRADTRYLMGQVFWGAPDGSTNTRDRVAMALRELIEANVVQFYTVRGQDYCLLRNFNKHQRIDKPSKPKCPGPDESSSATLDEPSTSPRRALAEPSTSPRRALDEPSPSPRRALEEPSSRAPGGIGSEGIGEDRSGSDARDDESEADDCLLRNFNKHQRIDKPSKPKCPGPDESSSATPASPRRALDEPSPSPRRALDEPSTRAPGGIGSEGIGEDRSGSDARDDESKADDSDAGEITVERPIVRGPIDDWAARDALAAGGISVAMGGTDEREWAAVLRSLAGQGFALADFVALGECVKAGAATWWDGDWNMRTLLGKHDGGGGIAARGLIRSLEAARGWKAKARPKIAAVHTNTSAMPSAQDRSAIADKARRAREAMRAANG